MAKKQLPTAVWRVGSMARSLAPSQRGMRLACAKSGQRRHVATGGVIYSFFYDSRRRRRGSVSTMTRHQCWNVCDWKTTEEDQPSEAQLSLPHIESQEKTILPTVAITLSPPFNLPTVHTTRWHKRKEGTPPEAHHDQTVSKIQRTLASKQNSKGLPAHVPSPSFISLTTSLSFVVTICLR